MVTFTDVRTLDTTAFHATAVSFSDLARAVALSGDDIDVASRSLVTWGGDAGPAATAKLKKKVDDTEEFRERLAELDRTLSDHAAAMERLQRLVSEIMLEATAGGAMNIDPSTGVITVSASDGSAGDVPVKPQVLEARNARARQYADEISDVLTQAATVDAETAARLRSLMTSVTVATRPGNAKALLAGMPALGTSPWSVRTWWEGLTDAEKEFLIRERPDDIGGLDGVPAIARDEANRLILNATATGMRSRVNELRSGPRTEQEEKELAVLNAKLRGIEDIEKRLYTFQDGQLRGTNGRESAPDRAYLLGFDARGNGKAIVAIGNPDTADNMVTYVPGTGARLEAANGDLVRADRMASDANVFDPAHKTSAIMWIGYEAPQTIMPEAMSARYAEQGADALSNFQDGLRASHDGGMSHNTVLGHSYGSTVVGITAKNHYLNADDVAFVGSPGTGVDNVGQLHDAQGKPFAGDHVFSSHAKNDPIQYASYREPIPFNSDFTMEPAEFGVHGRNPSQSEYGATVFSSDPGEAVATMKAHSQYWDPMSTSRRNLTYIVTGRPELVN